MRHRLLCTRFSIAPSLGYDGHHVCECRKVLWSKAGKAKTASAHSYRSGLQLLPLLIQDDRSVIEDDATRRVRARAPHTGTHTHILHQCPAPIPGSPSARVSLSRTTPLPPNHFMCGDVLPRPSWP